MASRVFILIGSAKGLSGTFGSTKFRHGRATITGLSEEDLNKMERLLRRFYSAEPEGPLAVAAQQRYEVLHGKGDTDPDRTDPERSKKVLGEAGEGTDIGGEEAAHGSADGTGDPAAQERQAVKANGEGAEDTVTPQDERLLDAILELDPENDNHWTADGLPAMKAVEAVYGSSDILRKHVTTVAEGYDRNAAKERRNEG